MEKISSPLAEFVKVLYTSQVLITVKAAPTKKASVRCVAKRFWIPKTTSRLPCRYVDEDPDSLGLYFVLQLFKA